MNALLRAQLYSFKIPAKFQDSSIQNFMYLFSKPSEKHWNFGLNKHFRHKNMQAIITEEMGQFFWGQTVRYIRAVTNLK